MADWEILSYSALVAVILMLGASRQPSLDISNHAIGVSQSLLVGPGVHRWQILTLVQVLSLHGSLLHK